jgi:protein-tyrosine-phosphatase
MKKSFCIVCIANYCRSPVVENLLKKRFEDRYEFFSAGVAPISLPSMDPRSLKYLQESNVNYNFHTPKKINKKMLRYFDAFLAVDFFVLSQLNIAYPRYKHKFHLLASQFRGINILDPYHLQADEYLKTMNNIKHVVEKIDLEDI